MPDDLTLAGVERTFRNWTGGTPKSIQILLNEIDRLRERAAEPRHEVECPSCGATIRARMADAPAEGVAALLRRCDERDEGDPNATYHGWMLTTEVRALLGGADNNEGER